MFCYLYVRMGGTEVGHDNHSKNMIDGVDVIDVLFVSMNAIWQLCLLPSSLACSKQEF